MALICICIVSKQGTTRRIKQRFIDKIALLIKIMNGNDITRCPKCNGKLCLYKEIYTNKSPPNVVNQGVLIDA